MFEPGPGKRKEGCLPKRRAIASAAWVSHAGAQVSNVVRKLWNAAGSMSARLRGRDGPSRLVCVNKRVWPLINGGRGLPV